uniref:Uncharacterized protein n=1 Tax=Anopheles minimus TaxID=112268 RepID=A0A182WMS6_9DIPT
LLNSHSGTSKPCRAVTCVSNGYKGMAAPFLLFGRSRW